MKVILISLLLVIFYEDLKARAVHWWLFPCVLLTSVLLTFDQFVLSRILFNVFYLILIVLLLTIYVSIRKRKFINIAKGYFSVGDSLFLLVVTPLFSIQNFIFFIVISSIYSLLTHFTLVKIKKSRMETIPYAGYASILLCGIILFKESLLWTK